MTIDDASLAAIESRARATTPGTWIAEHEHHPPENADWRIRLAEPERHPITGKVTRRYIVNMNLREADAAFIVHARADILLLVAALRTTQRQLQDLQNAAKLANGGN